MTSCTLHRMLAIAGIVLSGAALAACAPAAKAGPGARASPGPAARSAAVGYPGYQWRLVSVSHDEKVTPIPARYSPIMEFSPDGQFFASDGIHGYSGMYRVASGAFTTSDIAGTTNGSTGNDPITLLTISATNGLVEHARHPVRLTGDQLVVSSGPYALTYRRAGRVQHRPAIGPVLRRAQRPSGGGMGTGRGCWGNPVSGGSPGARHEHRRRRGAMDCAHARRVPPERLW